MDNQSKPQLGPYQKGVQKALQQAGEQQTIEALQQGVPADHIQQQAFGVNQAQQIASKMAPQIGMDQVQAQVNQLASTPVPVKGSGLLGGRVGILPALLKTVSGSPTSPFDRKTEPMGMDGAVQLLSLRESMNNNAREGDLHPLKKTELEQKTNPAYQDERLRTQESIKSQIQSGSQVLTEERKKFNDFLVGANRTYSLLDNIRSSASELGDFQSGTFEQLGAQIGALGSSFAKDSRYVRFDAAVNQALGNLARDSFGEKGPLANPDIARTLKGMAADKTVPLADKLAVLDDVEGQVTGELDVRKSLAEISGDDFQKRFPRIHQYAENSKLPSITPQIASKKGGVEVDEATGVVYDKNNKPIGRLPKRKQ